MDRLSNNLLATMLIFLMMVSALCTTTTLQRIAQLRNPPPETGKIAGMVGVCVSNPPRMTLIGDLSVLQNKGFYLDINDTQAYHNNEKVGYFDNATFFEINRTTGVINFTATNSMVGEHRVKILANESICGAGDYKVINFTVLNVNDAPLLDHIPDFNLTEDITFTYDVNATDPDLLTPRGETLTFGDNTTLFEIEPETGIISFIPVQSEMGNYSVMIFVFDPQYVDWQVVHINVFPVNDAPVMSHIGAQTAIVGHEYRYDVNATDEEGDAITFSDNTSLFEINPLTGLIRFTPNSSMIDNYTIAISASDGDKTSTEAVSFAVTTHNHAPNITYWYPNEREYSRAREIANKTTSVWFYVGDAPTFRINVTDPDGNTPSVSWAVDNVTIPGETYMSYALSLPQSGMRIVKVTATDGLLNDTHEWIVVVLARPQPSVPPSGGGGGSPARLCQENWRCTEWSTCSAKGIQTRTCIDLNKCSTFVRKPSENMSCVYTPYPTCFDGIKNCHNGQCEIMADCGGPCDPCPTCDDKTRNQGEESVDCGGPCPPCPEKCIRAITRAINTKTGECRLFQSPCDVLEGWKVVDECPPVQPVFLLLYIIILSFIATASALIWTHRESIKWHILGEVRYGAAPAKNKKMSRQDELAKKALDSIETGGAQDGGAEGKAPDDDEEKGK